MHTKHFISLQSPPKIPKVATERSTIKNYQKKIKKNKKEKVYSLHFQFIFRDVQERSAGLVEPRVSVSFHCEIYTDIHYWHNVKWRKIVVILSCDCENKVVILSCDCEFYTDMHYWHNDKWRKNVVILSYDLCSN